ncbi:hypothetical protein [Gorillibacterium sp. sgz500922]|uniref:hypothetical protein n=1 Tax=Gorillibacterium sp. sgz500922 TaxID=3446694 RepID=UPI003F67626F
MAYCTQCGAKLEEGTVHDCPAKAAQPVWVGTDQGEKARRRPDVNANLLLAILRDPLAAFSLQPARDSIYGILGLAASIIGFFLWGLVLKFKLVRSFGPADGIFSDIVGGTVRKLPIASHLLLLGLFSLAALILLLWAVGQWKGSVQRSGKEVLTHLGAMQLQSGAGFALAALVAFLWVPGSFVIVAAFLLYTLLMTVLSALDWFGISAENRGQALAVFAGAYTVVSLVAFQLLIRDFGSAIF